MLPIVLVLLVVTSVIAAPTVSLTQYTANEIPRARDNGKASFLTERTFDLIDGGDTNVYIVTLENIINDLANLPDSQSQAIALSQALTVVGLLATGSPGDTCAAAALTKAYVNAARSGNFASIRPALKSYIEILVNSIAFIERLVVNPGSLRYTVGPVIGCQDEGRSYPLEAAWDIILANANPNQYRYLEEEYCQIKHLDQSNDKRSNNVGSALTALALPSTVRVFEQALGPLSNLVRVIANGGNPSNAAASARSALINAANRVQL